MKARVRDEVRSLARAAVRELDRRAETSDRVRRARPVLLGTAARGGRVLRAARVAGPEIRPRALFSEAYHRSVAAGRVIGARAPLSVGAARVGQGLDVSLRLYGSVPACAAVTGLALRAPGAGPGSRIEVPATVLAADRAVRLVARLPEAAFGGSGACLLLEILGAGGPLTVAVPRRGALGPAPAPGGPAAGWPARLRCDRRGRLVVCAAVPAGPALDYDVHIGIDGVRIAWPGGPAAAALRLRRQGSEETVEVVATAGPDGRYEASIGASQLWTEQPARWDLDVGSGESWIPLSRDPARYPALEALVTFAALPLSMPGRSARSAQVYYTADNRLAVNVTAAARARA